MVDPIPPWSPEQDETAKAIVRGSSTIAAAVDGVAHAVGRIAKALDDGLADINQTLRDGLGDSYRWTEDDDDDDGDKTPTVETVAPAPRWWRRLFGLSDPPKHDEV